MANPGQQLADWLDTDPGPDTAGLTKDARSNDRVLADVYDQGRSDAESSSGGSTSAREIPNATRKVVGLMAMAVIFSLVGYEIRNATGSSTPAAKTAGTLSGGAKIILGGTIATAILSFASEAGPAGQQFGVGIATVAVVTSLFVSGAPVWHAISNLVGTTKTSAPTGTTGTTDTYNTTATSPSSATARTGAT